MTAGTTKQRDKVPRRHRKSEKKTQIESVLSPHNCSFIHRTTIQRTPNKLCTLNLPSPLPSLFDDTSTSLDSNPTSPKARHKRAPSDLNSITVSVDPSVVTESSHPHRHSGASIVSSPDIPSYLRVGMSCDPLIAFDLVLVATTDGRVAVYQIVDFGLDLDEDVMASERRRLLEWEEEDVEFSDINNTNEEKKSPEDSFGFDESGDANERMSRRERSRESVDPLVIVSTHNAVDEVSSKDDDTLVDLPSNTPMIVGMCATPEGMSLIGSHENCPKPILGHVAVLTDDGGVHILEFTATNSSMIEERSIIHADAPNVSEICSFQSSHFGATCICMQPMGRDAKQSNAQSNAIEQMRLCIGHECGVLECYQLVTSQSPQKSSELESPYSFTKSKSNEVPRSNSNSTPTIETPKRNASFLSIHLAEDGNSNDSFDSSTKLYRTYSEPASRQQKRGNDMADSAIHITADLCWRGSINVPIRSMTCPGWSPSLVNKKMQSLISIGLMQSSSEENRMYGADPTKFRSTNQDLPPAISLEVIDASLAQEYWHKQQKEYKSGTTTNNQPSTILLCECSVWPQAGMEVRDGWTRAKEKVRQNLSKNPSIIINKMCELFCQ